MGLKKLGKWLDKKAEQVGNFVVETVKNPLPLIETIALTSVGVPPTLAAAAVSAANGGSPKQIITAALSAGVGEYVGGQAGESATSAGASTQVAKIAASAAGASSSSVVSALASGQSLEKALQAGLSAGALAGTTTGVIETGKYVLSSADTGQGIKAVPGTGTQLVGDQTSSSGLGLTQKIATGGGQGLTIDPASALYSSQFAPSTGKVRNTETGGLQPAYTSASARLAPSSFDSTSVSESKFKEPKTITQKTQPVMSSTTEQIVRPFVSSGLSDLFGLRPKAPSAPSAGGSSLATRTSAISSNLGGERGAGEIESKETGKSRQNVWNEESLRLKDALGV